MKLTYKIIAGAAAALSLAVAATVSAHPGGGFGGMGPGGAWGMGPGMMGNGGWGMGPGMMGWAGDADVSALASGRTAQLKAVLKITPAQESAWKAYETSIQQQVTTMQAARGQMLALMRNAQPGADSKDFIAQRDAMIKLHDANLEARTKAVKDLYAVLTPEQRAIADRSVGPMGGYGYHMGGWGPVR